MKNFFAFAALLFVSTVLLNGRTNAQDNLTYGGTLQTKLIGIERVLPNGNIVVADIEYADRSGHKIGAVYLYDQTRENIISVLKGAKDGDRIGSGGINVLANGDFEIFSPEWQDARSNKTGAITTCSQTSGCDAAVSAKNSRFGSLKQTSDDEKSRVESAMLAPQAGTPVFDTITNNNSYSLPTATRTFMGQPYNLAAGTTDLRISSFRTFLASAVAVNYTEIQLNVAFWGAFDSAATPVFSNSLGLYTYSLGAANTTANAIYDLNPILPQAVILPGTTNLGIAFNYKGNSGAGLVNTDNLTTAVRGGASAAPIAVGSTPVNAYYRNASGRMDLNFAAGDARSIGANSALAVAVFNYLPTAAPISISGRVTDGKRGLANASVEITGADGNVRSARTNSLGYFAFREVEAGATYVINVAAKRYSFAPQVVSAAENVNDLVFAPQ